MWQVSRILNKSPFDDEILQLNPAQISFIIRMHVRDNPDKYKLNDPSIPKGEHPIQILVANADKLLGKSKAEYDRNPIKYLKKYYGSTNK